ncbi:FecR family protein [Larkinella soli]|uniref:FecR family protein n=1 Tax=Larkinella soli TaxID=1770527 RepID=UPI000FFB77F3|nr:FecR family protein [Larkinella soli]
MDRKGFLDLLQRYLNGTCTPEERELVDRWYEELEQEDPGGPKGMSKEQLEALLWSRINTLTEPVEAPAARMVPGWRSRPWMPAAAASVVLAAGLLWVLRTRQLPEQIGWERTPVALSGLHEEANPGKVTRMVRLEDGSRIRLEPGSSVRYAEPFAVDRRIVYLSGNALFEVTKNPKKPFVVYAGDIVTKVLGTSFTIRSSVGDTEVAVLTGRVMVEKRSGAASDPDDPADSRVVLTPNQKVTYFPHKNHFVTGLVAMPLLVKMSTEVVKPTLFRYEDVPLTDVLNEVEAAYGIEIVVENEGIRTCPITADLTQQSLYTKLEVICAALKANFDIKGTRIIITGGSCL